MQLLNDHAYRPVQTHAKKIRTKNPNEKKKNVENEQKKSIG